MIVGDCGVGMAGESFNGRLRNELLNGEISYSRREAQMIGSIAEAT